MRTDTRGVLATYLREYQDPLLIECIVADDTIHGSHNYTYSFEPKTDWSANYASSREIFTYFTDFVDKYGLREYISLQHEVIGARWEEENGEWVVQVRKGRNESIFEQRADFIINAAGILNAWRWPPIPGIQSFKGPLLHSAAWAESVDLAGKHV